MVLMIIFWREYCRQAWGLATVRIQEIYAKSSESVVLRGATVLAQSQRDCGVKVGGLANRDYKTTQGHPALSETECDYY